MAIPSAASSFCASNWLEVNLLTIYEKVSKEAWNMWMEHMKMLMNEYRLNLATLEAQEFLIKQMEEYFFGAGSALPPDFVPQKAK